MYHSSGRRTHCALQRTAEATQASSDGGVRSAPVYRWAAQDGPRKGLYRIFLYKIQPNQFHTVLLYNRGTEPHTILCGHPGRPGAA